MQASLPVIVSVLSFINQWYYFHHLKSFGEVSVVCKSVNPPEGRPKRQQQCW